VFGVPGHVNGLRLGDALVPRDEGHAEGSSGSDGQPVNGVDDRAGEGLEVTLGSRVQRDDVQGGGGIKKGGPDDLVPRAREGLRASVCAWQPSTARAW
jgi:hypothetical protein